MMKLMEIISQIKEIRASTEFTIDLIELRIELKF